MIAGCGRAGDFSGDPTAWITPIKALLTAQGLFVYFTVNPALPPGSDLYLYIDGEVRDRGTGDGELYEQEDLPLSVAVAAVAPGIGDSTYDPLCGSTVNKFSIEVEELSEPLTVLTRNAGNGSMEVAWQRPVSGVPSLYEIHVGTASGGTFYKVDRKDIEGLIARVYNLTFGTTLYTKVRGIDVLGTEGPFSELARDAVIDRARGILKFEGPIGDEIEDKAFFTSIYLDELLGMRVLQSGVITGG